jgi:hypothetical protein
MYHVSDATPGQNRTKNIRFAVDGHVAYTKIYWENVITNGGFMACFYDPPAEFQSSNPSRSLIAVVSSQRRAGD